MTAVLVKKGGEGESGSESGSSSGSESDDSEKEETKPSTTAADPDIEEKVDETFVDYEKKLVNLHWS